MWSKGFSAFTDSLVHLFMSSAVHVPSLWQRHGVVSEPPPLTASLCRTRTPNQFRLNEPFFSSNVNVLGIHLNRNCLDLIVTRETYIIVQIGE